MNGVVTHYRKHKELENIAGDPAICRCRKKDGASKMRAANLLKVKNIKYSQKNGYVGFLFFYMPCIFVIRNSTCKKLSCRAKR